MSAERRRRYLFFAGLAVLLLYNFPYFEKIRSANELPRVYLTAAMVDEGRFSIDSGVRRWGATADISPSDGHLYSNKAPGSSMLAIPGYLALKATRAVVGGEPTLAEMVWVSRVTTGVVPTLLFLIALWSFLARFTESPSVRRMVIAAYALGTMAMPYSVLFIAHQLSAVCVAAAYFVTASVLDGRRSWRWMAVAGLAAGAAPLVDYQAAFAMIPVAIWAGVRLLRQSQRLRIVSSAAAGAAIPIAILLFYHWQAFGSPWTTGYAASETFAHYHQRGFLGLDKLRVSALYGSFLAPDNGLLVFSPFLLAAVPGWWWMIGNPRWREHAWLSMAVVAVFVAFISALVFWRGGWQLGPRYITVMLPFAMLPVAVTADRAQGSNLGRGLFWATVVVAIAVYALSCAQYPHFPEKFANPFYEITLRLMADGYAPYNAGWLAGLRGTASLLPYIAILLALCVWLSCPQRRFWRSAVLGWVVGITILVLYSRFPRSGADAERAYQRWVAGAMPAVESTQN